MSIHSQYVTGRKEVTIYVFLVFQEVNIRGLYKLCVRAPPEELVASLTSAYVLTQLVVELTAAMEAAVFNLCTQDQAALTASLASVYDLSTAAP